jgi:hypothetical protein
VTPPRPRPWPTSSAAGPRRPRGALQPWANVTSLADRPDLRVSTPKVTLQSSAGGVSGGSRAIGADIEYCSAWAATYARRYYQHLRAHRGPGGPRTKGTPPPIRGVLRARLRMHRPLTSMFGRRHQCLWGQFVGTCSAPAYAACAGWRGRERPACCGFVAGGRVGRSGA